jgi:proteasome lid subunit RPN8/RPN11
MFFNHVDEVNDQRLRTSTVANLKTWRIPQCPFVIQCSAVVLDQIRREVDAARNLSGGEQETGGVLFGIHEPGRICIVDCKPLQCEHAVGPGFVLSEEDEKHLAKLLSAPGSNLNGVQALGWYHSHIRSRIFLSERDLLIHSRYFAGPYQIALVVHPRSDGTARVGVFFRESSGEMRTESSYEAFSIEAPPSVPEIKQTVVSNTAHSHKQTSSRTKLERRREVVCPACGSNHLRRSRRTGPIERFGEVFGYCPYRCHECLSRSFLKTSPDLLERARSSSRKRPEERKRAWQRTRRGFLLWAAAVVGFLVILRYLTRDVDPKPDQP